MSPLITSVTVFGCVFGGALLGLLLRAALPQHHLSADSRDVVKLGSGLVGTMAALVLGLLVASAKDSYDAQRNELEQLAANVGVLDRILAHYGPETQDARAFLRAAVARVTDTMWSEDKSGASRSDATSTAGEKLLEKIQGLSPADDRQRALQAQAFSLTMTIGQTRWLMYEQRTTSVSRPLLAVLVLWLTVIFVSFGLFARANGTVVTSLCVSAMSVSGAIFLILEMYTPYTGLVQISSAPLRAVLAHLGQ